MLLDLELGSELPRSGGPTSRKLQGALLHADAPEWDGVLRSTRHDFYHLPAYVALCAAQEPGEPRALLVTDGARTMLLPLVVRSIVGAGVDATSPYGYPGPIGPGTDDPRFVRLALVCALNVLGEAGIVSAFVRLHPLLNPEPPQGIGTLVAHGETVSIDLTSPVEQLWAETRLNHRRDINRALRLGYVARMDNAWTHSGAFKQLYRATMARRSAAPRYYFADTYFDGLRDALGESLHLCIVEKDGVIASAGLFIETDGIVQYHLSGTDEAHQRVQPTKLMLHFVSRWAKGRGNETLHLGGGVGGNRDSLLQFKMGFSPRRHIYHSLRLVIDEQGYRRLVAARDASLDPGSRTGFFPLYRKE
jgi:hypothetical protein